MKEKIETRLNFTYHRNLRYSPYEIIYKNSPFENINIRDNIDYQKIIKYTRQSITKNENETNAERKTHQYLENQYIYKRNHSPDKLDPKWKGPYRIHHKVNNNQFIIEENGKHTKQNIKNIRPAIKEGVDVAPQLDCDIERS